MLPESSIAGKTDGVWAEFKGGKGTKEIALLIQLVLVVTLFIPNFVVPRPYSPFTHCFESAAVYTR